MNVGDLMRCMRGREHRVEAMFYGVPMVVCPGAPDGPWFLMNTDYCHGTTDVPLPPARPTFALRTLRIVPPRKPFIPPAQPPSED